MTHYSYAQLEGLWIQAGGAKSLAPLMAAIAEAESGGNSTATGGVGEKGLWQINPHAWGSLATYDPLGNAKAAVHVEKVQGLGAWSTYTSGAYKRFYNSKTSPTGVPTGTGQAPGTTTAAGRGSGGVSGSATSPNPATSSTPPAPAPLTAADKAQTGTCLVGVPNPVTGLLSVLPGISPTTVCLFSKTNARAVVGGLMMAAGSVWLIVGLAVLTAETFGKTKTGMAAKKVAKKTVTTAAAVGAPEAAVPLKAGSKVAGKAVSRQSAEDAQERHTASQYKKQPQARRRLERDEGRQAERETGRDRARRMANPPRSREPVPF